MSRRAVRLAAALWAAVLFVSGCSGTSDDCPDGASCLEPRPSVRATTSAWTRIADAPTSRQEVAAAVVGGNVYVVGGLVEGGGATNAVEIYNPITNRWSTGPPLPRAIHHAMAAAFRGELLVVMGGSSADGRASDRVYQLNPPREQWVEIAPLRRARAAGAAVSVGDSIVVVGGVADGRHVVPVEIFDGRSWRDGAAIPSLRDHLGAATDGKLVYAAAGRRGGGHFATFEAYDPAADRWSKLPDMPTARSGIGAAFVGGKIVTAGGEGPRMFPEVEAYDIATRRWTRLPDLAVPVHGVGLAAVSESVYAFTGGVRVGLAPTRSCQVLEV